jgi:hypothetical protein
MFFKKHITPKLKDQNRTNNNSLADFSDFKFTENQSASSDHKPVEDIGAKPVNIINCNFENIGKLIDYLGALVAPEKEKEVEKRHDELVTAVDNIGLGDNKSSIINELRNSSIESSISTDDSAIAQKRMSFIDKVLFYLDSIAMNIFEFVIDCLLEQ